MSDKLLHGTAIVTEIIQSYGTFWVKLVRGS